MPGYICIWAALYFSFEFQTGCCAKFEISWKFSLGDEAALIDDSSWSMDHSTVLEVKTVYICSAILAGKSPFFIKVKRSDCGECHFVLWLSLNSLLLLFLYSCF